MISTKEKLEGIHQRYLIYKSKSESESLEGFVEQEVLLGSAGLLFLIRYLKDYHQFNSREASKCIAKFSSKRI